MPDKRDRPGTIDGDPITQTKNLTTLKMFEFFSLENLVFFDPEIFISKKNVMWMNISCSPFLPPDEMFDNHRCFRPSIENWCVKMQKKNGSKDR